MNTVCDLLVIGAGIHGAGVAQAAAARGYSVRVLEQVGVASGTSCRSSKLIHGGLRYLESGQFDLVRESLRERDTLLRIAPTLVRRVPFHVPVYRDSRRGAWTLRAGLSLYALLAGLRARSGFRALPRREWARLDGLDTQGLRAVFRYEDAQTDDAALTLAVMRSAQSLGAVLHCPAAFTRATRTNHGWRVHYRDRDGEHFCETRAIVNAAGPWVNDVLPKLGQSPAAIELVQGTHIVIDGAMQHGVYYAEAADGRAVFIMPWRGMTLIGTTETRYAGDPAQVRPLPGEVDYLRQTFQRHFPNRDFSLRDQFAGLRVLPRGDGAAFHRPRETQYLADDERAPRLVSVIGGKLTGYRAAAQQVMQRLAPALPPPTREGNTARLMIGRA
jgi:glycerol-3-phosphate dehydrogenase